MSEVGFYHLTRSTLAEALPQLLSRTLTAGQRALVLGADEAALQALSASLWADPNWLPHGRAADGDPDLQPIWLSTSAEPVNNARFLFVVGGTGIDRTSEYSRVFDLFDGNDQEALAAARLRWQAAKDAGHQLTYWQQTETSWRKSA